MMMLCLGVLSVPTGSAQISPAPKSIPIEPSGKGDLRLLGGPPETVTMRSGCVILAPGKSVGKHSTRDNEELLVILEGQGEMRIGEGTILRLNPKVIAYCPPRTEHDVFNTGTGPLRYIYVVAKAQ